jgi:DNA-binding IclR family transcriptional regulator
MHKEKSAYAVQAVENAFDILDSLTGDVPDATLPHLAARLGISRNKAFRLLATLENRGLVEREEISGMYRLGLSTVEMAQRFMRCANLVRLARPVMEALARRHDEAVYLTVVRGDEVLFLDMVDCDRQIKAMPLVGKRFPFFTNAAGKAIRAFESRDALERFAKRRRKGEGFPDVATLEDEMNAIKQRGVAVDNGGLGDGVISVAVAVKDYAGKVVGALTLLGPSFRLMASRLENEIIPSLQESAEMLSMKFGYARV